MPRFSQADLDEMRELGASDDEIDALLAQEPEPEAFEVAPDNWLAVQLYLSVYGQFRVSGTGQVLGFDFTAVDIDIRRSQIEVDPQTWERFKVLSHHTVTTLNQRSGS